MMVDLKHIVSYLLLPSSLSSLSSLSLRIYQGDLTEWKEEKGEKGAIVNAANSVMLGGGGVDGAIHRAAGPQLKSFTSSLPIVGRDERGKEIRCPPGEALLTPSFFLSSQVTAIIHTVGPIYVNDKVSSPVLKQAYHSCLQRGEENGIESLAFPALSCGVYGYPKDKAASISLKTIQDYVIALIEKDQEKEVEEEREKKKIEIQKEEIDERNTIPRTNYRHIDFVLFNKEMVEIWIDAAEKLGLQKITEKEEIRFRKGKNKNRKAPAERGWKRENDGEEL